MPIVSQSQLTLESGNKPIRLDAYLPGSVGKYPAVLTLYGSGGGISGMREPAIMLAEQGFAVFVLHYFDHRHHPRHGQANDLPQFPVWGKTVWDMARSKNIRRWTPPT
jgi:dienelactone hydrolase